MSSVRVVRKDTTGRLYIVHEGMRWFADKGMKAKTGDRIQVEFSGIGIAGGGYAWNVKSRTSGGPWWISEGCP